MFDLKLIAKTNEEKVSLQTTVYKSVYDKLMSELEKEKVTMSAFLRHCINTFLEDRTKKMEDL